jgi:hypothetical protein
VGTVIANSENLNKVWNIVKVRFPMMEDNVALSIIFRSKLLHIKK